MDEGGDLDEIYAICPECTQLSVQQGSSEYPLLPPLLTLCCRCCCRSWRCCCRDVRFLPAGPLTTWLVAYHCIASQKLLIGTSAAAPLPCVFALMCHAVLCSGT